MGPVNVRIPKLVYIKQLVGMRTRHDSFTIECLETVTSHQNAGDFNRAICLSGQLPGNRYPDTAEVSSAIQNRTFKRNVAYR